MEPGSFVLPGDGSLTRVATDPTIACLRMFVNTKLQSETFMHPFPLSMGAHPPPHA